MSQRTQCDRCGALVELKQQAYEMAVGPLRAPEAGQTVARPSPSSYDKYLQLCHACHAALKIFLDVEKI